MFGKAKRHNDSSTAETRRVRGLRAQLHEAHDVHRLAADPLLGAVRADRFRVSVTRSMWFFLAIGLGFTTTGVHDFLAGHLTAADPMWWGAWLVEPALAGILITLLRWEAEMLSKGLAVDHQAVTRLKRVLLGATLVTNVWSSLRPASGSVDAGMVFLHVVIPVVVYLLAEVMPVIQQRCNTARELALASTPHPAVEPVPDEPAPAVEPVSAVPAPAPADVVPIPRPGPRLPRHLLAQLDAKTAETGRPLTAEEVRDVLNVPADYAARIATQLAA
ncbi:hypothetical protein [Umezawaea beigongshangensis]|uniref:hypothetical protein n=1 Tax=Umezawaea beigongshangensis TaxID=2780383 RepID=UPI0018F160CD|nr:hypothetical protein [Umezawaea beigongshangensis]